MIYDQKQDKYFYEGKWLAEQECTSVFLELVQRNQREMDASPNKAFYDSVRVASGGERVKDVIFEEEELKDLLVQLESDIREGIDESLVLGPTQYSTKERTFRGGIIINQAEFEVLPKEISDLLHESRRDKIIPEHERMRFDDPVKSVLSSYQRDYLQELDCVVGVGKPVVKDLEGK